jgi:hypothetical protein
MSEAMRSIVDGYVSLKNRFALEEMRQHRQELRNELRMKTGNGFDFSRSVSVLDDDLQAIEDGFARLQGSPSGEPLLHQP